MTRRQNSRRAMFVMLTLSGLCTVGLLAAGEALAAHPAATAVSFDTEVVPLLTKLGCNSGGCHGKASGQNGFRLSLLGFEPKEDYEHLVKEARGRRLFPAAPDRSLLLEKGIGSVPHGGGARIVQDSYNHRMIRRWIEQGMPYGKPEDPEIARIEVFPRERTMLRGGEQQLQVTAFYTDGSSEDVTQIAQFDANDTEMAEVSLSGLVTTGQLTGSVAVMARYQGHVGVFRATIPLGVETTNLPAGKNFIDECLLLIQAWGDGNPPFGKHISRHPLQAAGASHAIGPVSPE